MLRKIIPIVIVITIYRLIPLSTGFTAEQSTRLLPDELEIEEPYIDKWQLQIKDPDDDKVPVFKGQLLPATLQFLYAPGEKRKSLAKDVKADRIIVEKTKRRLSLLYNGSILKTYRISLGRNPNGPKRKQGDFKTPEGTYQIDYRNRNSRYHLALHISYPNYVDRKRARALKTSPGGDIMIHGIGSAYKKFGRLHGTVDWTEGCIAVTDEEIREIWRLVPDGTLIEIKP
jgi:hypothetical protein